MTGTRAWLAARRDRGTRTSLDVALLTDQGRRYVVSRVWVIGARAVLRVAVHAAELTFLASVFPLEFLVPLFSMRALPGLISGLHWGALEALRARVRLEVGRGRRHLATAATEGYLLVAAAGGAAAVALVIALCAQSDDPFGQPFGLYGAFAVASAIAVAIDLWTRTFHAGVFALGRVYRPAWTLFAPDLLELCAITGGWRWLGPFSVHLAVLLGALLRGAVAWIYARRAYRARRLAVPRTSRLRSLARVSRHDLAAAVRYAFATVPLQLDRLLLLALLHAPAASGGLALGVPYYALRPVAAFSQGWARGFYADFVRLDAADAGVLRARFERLLGRAALVTGSLSALALAAGASLLFGLPGLQASLWLVPLALVRARFTLEQVRGFVYGAHGALALTGVSLLLGLGCAAFARLDDRTLLLLVLVVLLGSLWAARRIGSRARERSLGRVARVALSSWLHVVSATRAPVRITVARVDPRVAPLGAVLRALGPELAQRGHVARVGRAWLLWWEPLDGAREPAHWARALGGTLADLRAASGDTGLAALAQARAQGLLPGELARALDVPQPSDPRDELKRSAAELVPAAEALDLRAHAARLRELPPAELALVRQAIISGAREQLTVPRRARQQVAVYAPGGEPELVFVWPAGAGTGGGELRRRVQHASWRASLAAPLADQGRR